jgi:voltage-gated potassium channel Kch
MHGLDLIVTLTSGLTAALVFGYVTHRIGLSPIVGYLIAGTLVGPNTPGFVADASVAEQLAEVGVILLMFGVGLQFHIEELLAVRRIAIPGAVAQSAVATALGIAIARALGWTWSAGVTYGVALSVASTVVLVRVLADNRDLHTRTGHIAVGWLVVEDLFTVIALVLLPVLLAGSTAESSLAYGDAGSPEILEKAGVPEAQTLILTSAGMEHSEEVIRAARQMNPRIRIMARSAYLRGIDALKRAGADTVFSGEGEVAFAFTEALLVRLGATPDQIDRERARVHGALSATFTRHARVP